MMRVSLIYGLEVEPPSGFFNLSLSNPTLYAGLFRLNPFRISLQAKTSKWLKMNNHGVYNIKEETRRWFNIVSNFNEPNNSKKLSPT